MKRLYHGTDIDGLKSIIECGYIGTDYFGETGTFLADNYLWAENHGKFVFYFDDIKPKEIALDGTNDGYYFKGKLDIKRAAGIMVNPLYLSSRDIQVMLLQYASCSKILALADIYGGAN
jgi:hypothetical protein